MRRRIVVLLATLLVVSCCHTCCGFVTSRITRVSDVRKTKQESGGVVRDFLLCLRSEAAGRTSPSNHRRRSVTVTPTTTSSSRSSNRRRSRHRNSFNPSPYQNPSNPDLFQAFDPVKDKHNALIVEERNQLLAKIADNKLLTFILKSWANSAELDGADRCYEVLDHLRKPLNKIGNLTANQYTYGVVVNAYARRGQPERCESVLRGMISSLSDVSPSLSPPPNVILFNTVMNAWSKSDSLDAPERCTQLLEEMQAHGLNPDVFTCTTVIDAYSKGGRAEEAEQFLMDVLRQGGNGPRDTPSCLNAFAFSSVMNAWSKSDASDAPEHCLGLLKEMVQRNICPDTFTYATAIGAFATRGRAEEAESLLREMVEEHQLSPDVVSFSSVIHAWSKSEATDAPDRCMRLLNEMHKRVLGPNTITYTNVIDALAKHNRPEEAESVLREMQHWGNVSPNSVLLSSVMNAWAKSDARDAPDRCMQLLNEMNDLGLVADVVAHNIVIDSLAKRGRGRDAEAILDHMLLGQKVSPCATTFNSVMAAWSKSNNENGPYRCMRLLRQMKAQGLSPNTVTYTTIIASLARRGRALEAEGILRGMLKRQKGVPLPNEYSFNAAMVAWMHADAKEAPDRCRMLLQEMKQFFGNVHLTTATRNTIMEVFKKRGRTQEAEILLEGM